MIRLTNNAGSSLVVAIAAADTEVQIQTADTSKFPVLEYPGDVFPVRIRDNAGNYEYVLATAREGNRITILRGREGTTAKDFPAGAGFELVVTGEAWARLAEGRWVRPMDDSRNLLLPTRVDATTFTIAGDVTDIFRPNRALHLIQTTDAFGYVATSSYAGGATTITVQSCTVDAGLALVELGLEVESAPKYGNAANSDTLGGKTKAEVIAEAQGIVSTFGRTLMDDADAAAARTTLGLGSAAQLNTGTDAEKVPTNANLGSAAYANTGTGSGNIPVLDSNSKIPSALLPAMATDRTWGVYKAGTYTFTVPAGVTSVEVWLAGGGGGGGRTWTCNQGGVRGGGGGGCIKTLTVTPGAKYTIVLGLGGLQNTGLQNGGTSGYAGNPSTFAIEGQAAMMTANGGSAGTGGTATGGDYNMSGGAPYASTESAAVQYGGKSGLGDEQRHPPNSNYQPKDIRGVGGGGASGNHYVQAAHGADGYCEIYW